MTLVSRSCKFRFSPQQFASQLWELVGRPSIESEHGSAEGEPFPEGLRCVRSYQGAVLHGSLLGAPYRHVETPVEGEGGRGCMHVHECSVSNATVHIMHTAHKINLLLWMHRWGCIVIVGSWPRSGLVTSKGPGDRLSNVFFDEYRPPSPASTQHSIMLRPGPQLQGGV